MNSILLKQKKLPIKDVFYYVIIALWCYIFFFLIGEKGTLISKDSYSFLEWSYVDYREGYMLYPWFIKLVRVLHGEKNYLEYIHIYQGVISMISNLALIKYIRKRYGLGFTQGLLLHGFVALTYTFTLPEAVSSHYVMTEGIAIPLFMIYMLFFLHYILESSYFCLVGSFILCVVMYLTRPQLMLMLLVTAITFVVNELNKRVNPFKRKKVMIYSFAIAMLVFLIGVWGYFNIISGWMNSSDTNQLIEGTTGKALCLMKEEDINLYSEKDRDVYIELYRDCKTNHRLIIDFPQSILDYEEVHTIINENASVHETVIWNYFLSIGDDDGGLDSYLVRNRITATEILNHKAEYAGILLRLMASSLVASIFCQPQAIRLLCYIIAASLYLLAIIMIYYALKQKLEKEYIIPFVVILGSILINCIICNVLLYAQQRYVIYDMGLFYIFLLLLTQRLYEEKHRRM